MGKTERGAVWLDPSLTTPYDYYQFWVNTDDADVLKFLALFTFLPMDEIRSAGQLADVELNMVKAVLAFETTKITHGEEAAHTAWRTSVAAFNASPVHAALLPTSTIPRSLPSSDVSGMKSLNKTREELVAGIPAYELFHEAGVCTSRGEARRVLTQGGGYVNDRQIANYDEVIAIDQVNEQGDIILRKGKKTYFLVTIGK
jgi:tyrosyl-tRNA synthetase